MATIHPVPATPPNQLQAQARALFAQYGAFLRKTQACGTFNFPAYEEETRTLPTPYSAHGGEVLLALVDEIPAACIAYRATALDPKTAEIKRLFVAPSFRNQGLARTLISEALTRIAARAFTRVILDTDVVHMPGALTLYRSFGFRIYAPQQGDIAFLNLYLSAPRENPLPQRRVCEAGPL